MRLGIDIGGTNTDAVLTRRGEIIASAKAPNGAGTSDGVVSAVAGVLAAAHAWPAAIRAVVIGTTQFTNAFLERKNLEPVAAIRLCLPSNLDIDPMLDWPPVLAEIAGAHIYPVGGGAGFDGRVAVPLDEAAVRAAALDIAAKGLRNVAITGVFSTVNPVQEQRAGEIAAAAAPDLRITLSSRIGRISLIDRENAALINAMLSGFAGEVVRSVCAAMTRAGVSAPFYFSQNDGSLLAPGETARHPVRTFASGPANSMRGAARLSGFTDAIVVDIGGTTTDVGIIRNGFPRERTLPGRLAGVRTNFRMPDVLSIPLGGGSIVVADDAGLTIGPQSVAENLTSKSLVFGGGVLTATDIAVATGRARIGDPARLRGLPAALVERADRLIQEMISGAIDKMRISRDKLPVILVGGGRILASQDGTLLADAAVPPFADAANAVGAAFAQVSGENEQTVDRGAETRAAAIETARRYARLAAEAAGADPATLREVEIGETPLPYSTKSLVRVKSVGDLPLN